MINSKKTHHLFNINSDEIKKYLKLNSEIWSSLDTRSKYYGLDQSKSLLLLYNENIPEGFIPKFKMENLDVWNLIKPIIQETLIKTNSLYCCRAFIANLPAGCSIKSHIDPGEPFYHQHRYHWVIQSNEFCNFQVGKNNFSWKENEIWEFDNKSYHAAENLGKDDRIHLIFDLVCENEVLGIPPIPFMADSYDFKFFRNLEKKENKKTKSH